MLDIDNWHILALTYWMMSVLFSRCFLSSFLSPVLGRFPRSAWWYETMSMTIARRAYSPWRCPKRSMHLVFGSFLWLWWHCYPLVCKPSSLGLVTIRRVYHCRWVSFFSVKAHYFMVSSAAVTFVTGYTQFVVDLSYFYKTFSLIVRYERVLWCRMVIVSQHSVEERAVYRRKWICARD